ncbi:aminotransferase class V-fold PLP-dependent enzyme [Alphaproteobacteria bacterium]|nr:aminotransferase class V-fold PLP-dependent enzyme [Alphaproteobacteria bacterium]
MPLKPVTKPNRPFFSAGPCVRPATWQAAPCYPQLTHRSHRSPLAMGLIKDCLKTTRDLLSIPEDYVIFVVPGSGTGAMNSLIYNLLGPRPVHVMAFEVFSRRWANEVVDQLKIPHILHEAPFGALPDTDCSPENDILTVFNGTSSGVQYPDLEWISANRQGLVLCDTVSSVFATEIDWSKIDGMGFSWQKTMGAEAGVGTIVLSPRALKRLETYTPSWPIPYLLRLKGGEGLNESLVHGGVISTPSLISIDEIGKSLAWAQQEGGVPGLMARVAKNYHVMENWVKASSWCNFFVEDPAVRSPIALTLKTRHETDWSLFRKMGKLLDAEGAAYDIVNHSFAPPSLRVWCGPTVEPTDLENLCQWFDWAYQNTKD